MIEKAINKILELGKVEYICDTGGREYTSKRLIPVPEPAPVVLLLDTLQGLIDYLKSGFDGEEIGCITGGDECGCSCDHSGLRVALHVKSPHVVEAFLPVSGPWKDRVTVASAQWGRQSFPFGQWLDQEPFVIKMQAMFRTDNDWDAVMAVAGKIVCEDKAELMDNGISQAVTVTRGVRKDSGIILPNPVVLRPVRTFTEVEQPASAFVFRMKSDPVALSLHEADMGAWEMMAKERIRAYLVEQLPGVPVFV